MCVYVCIVYTGIVSIYLYVHVYMYVLFLRQWHVFKSASTPITHIYSLSSQESNKCLREGGVCVDTAPIARPIVGAYYKNADKSW